MDEKKENSKVVYSYNDSKGTGVMSSMLFAIIVIAIMLIIAYFKG